MNDAALILKELIRSTPDLNERLDHLTNVGLFTDDRRFFEFTERLRGLLVKREEMAKRPRKSIPRGTSGENKEDMQEKEAGNGLDETSDSIEEF